MADKNEMLDEIKQLYVKYCETFQVWKHALKDSEDSDGSQSSLFLSAKYNELKKITHDFEQKAETLFKAAVPETEDYKKFAVILAYAWNARLEWTCKDPEKTQESIELLKKVMNHLEPYEYDLMGICPYTFDIMIYMMLGRMGARNIAVLSRKFTYGAKTWINPKLRQAWNGAKLFDISAHDQSPDFILYQDTHSAETFVKCIGKFAVEFMRSISMNVEIASKRLKFGNLSEKIETIQLLEIPAVLFLESCQFKQSLHLLSVAMFHLVKIRRHFPVDERPTLNGLQAILSHGFASYGMALAKGSWIKYSHSNEYFDDADFEYFELTDLIEPGLEVYSSQFPIDYVDDPTEIKKILKKSIAWNKRAIELGSAGDEKMKEYEAMKVTLTEMLTN